MEDVPPAFQEAARCAVCDSAFSTFRRRHHCRCCGKSLCNEHSLNQMALPKFGITSAVRVCNDCFQASKQTPNGVTISEVDIDASKAMDSLVRLDLSRNDSPLSIEERPSVVPETQLHECTCGMPLCICQIPAAAEVIPSMQAVIPVISKKLPSVSAVSSGTSSAVKRVSASSSYGNELPSLFFSATKVGNGRTHPIMKKYEATGEGIWEAIKNGDATAVKDLLGNGVDPNHQDKQGMSLLHLAAVFNFTEITFLLMDAGAKVDAKNAQGETPIDCAPATLQYKMQQKMKSRMSDL